VKKGFLTITLALMLLLANTTAYAAGLPWQGHASPFDFLFGNHIDHHQQSKLISANRLTGFLYIHNTGEFIDGIPVAEHADCDMQPSDCRAGWMLSGVRATATLVSQPTMDEPQWCLNGDISVLPGFTHFHWLGSPDMDLDLVVGQSYSGFLLKLTGIDTFYFRHHGTLTLVTPGIDLESHANLVGSCT